MNNSISSPNSQRYLPETTVFTVDKPILKLPDEIILLILSKLKNRSDFASIARVDRQWNKMSKELTLSTLISNFVINKSENDFIFCKEDRIVIIDRSLDVDGRMIKIAAYSIFIAPDVVLKAKEIEFNVGKEIHCLGELKCQVFNTLGARKSFIHLQGPNEKISSEFKAISKF